MAFSRLLVEIGIAQNPSICFGKDSSRKEEILSDHYFHIILTLPHELNPVIKTLAEDIRNLKILKTAKAFF